MYSLLHDPGTGTASDRLVRRDADGAIIPADPENVDWRAFEAWRAEGNEPAAPVGSDPAPPPAPAKSRSRPVGAR